MSPKLLCLILILCCSQFLASVDGKGNNDIKIGVSGAGKGYHGVWSSGRRVDEYPEYETEKGVLIRAKRQGSTPGAPSGSSTASVGETTVMATTEHPDADKRASGFVTVFASLTGLLVFFGIANIALFVWLSMTLKRVRKP